MQGRGNSHIALGAFLLGPLDGLESLESRLINQFHFEVVNDLCPTVIAVPVRGLLENRVYCNPKHRVEHVRYYSGKERAAYLNRWVGVDLNQLEVHFIVYHEVVAKDLKGVGSPVWVYLALCCSIGVAHHSPDLREEISGEPEIVIPNGELSEVLIKVREGQLIGILEFSIVLRVLLDCVIREMDVFVAQVLS